jgi:POT family proton-dependent oligopeptide transporter
MFSSVNLYIDRLIQRDTLGITIPTTVFYSVESIFIILLGPFFAWSWHSLSESNKNPSYFSKFFLAILIIGMAMLTLAISTYFTDSSHKISALWIVFSYLLIAIGELLLSPIGLAAVTLLSPSHLTGMMMGIWFVALGFGGQFSGWLAKLSSIPESMTDPVQQLDIYRHAFFSFTYIAFGVAILLFLLKWLLRNRLPE